LSSYGWNDKPGAVKIPKSHISPRRISGLVPCGIGISVFPTASRALAAVIKVTARCSNSSTGFGTNDEAYDGIGSLVAAFRF